MRPTSPDSLSTSPHPQPVPSSSKAVASNGHSNGASSSSDINGHTEPPTPATVSLPGTTLYPDSNIDREQFVRLVIQTLRDVGYGASAATLEHESGYAMETDAVAALRTHVMAGAWADAHAALDGLGLAPEALPPARGLLAQQKYLELLEQSRTTDALKVLRDELAPLHPDPRALQPLSSLLMCTDPTDLRHRAAWDGAAGGSRRQLLVDLQHWIPSSLMIPPRRFPALLDQALAHQRSQCLWHNLPASQQSLYTDHACSSDAFPRHNTFSLETHTDEVWNLAWSHDGRRLATASCDKSVIVWRIEKPAHDGEEWTVREELTLKDHPYAVNYVAWSPDDEVLLTSSEQIIKMWNAKTGILIRTLDSPHTETVSALAWVSDGSGFVSGAQDRRIVLWSADGRVRDDWGHTPIRIFDLALTPDFTRLVAIGESANQPSDERDASLGARRDGSATPPERVGTPAQRSARPGYQIIVYDLATKTVEFTAPLENQLTSVSISADSRYALVNHAPDALLLWDLHAQRLVRAFAGQRQPRHVIRSCFGGVDEAFIVSGSEDGRVYVWHRERGVLLATLEAHGPGSVNAVRWNPVDPSMFASASDDHTVRVWQALPSLPPPLPLVEDKVGELRNGGGREAEGSKGKGKGKRRVSWDGLGGAGA
ncbi:WD40 repeat-like protein [Peniophora sp. CONT]|nr:WD40 repeat-like protein [Peniophora sp. CONT]